MVGFFDTPIEYLKGVGPQRAALLNKELNIFSFGDLIQHYPFRHEDRTQIFKIKELNDSMPLVQIRAKILTKELTGIGRKKRLVIQVADDSGVLELVWFQGANWILDKINIGLTYTIFGKPNRFGNKLSIAHPEMELVVPGQPEPKGFLHPVYPLTEKLRYKSLDNKAFLKLQKELLRIAHDKIRETLPEKIRNQHQLIAKREAIISIHFPKDQKQLTKAQKRLKFEELFYIQLQLLKLKLVRKEKFKGQIFDGANLVTTFYNEHLPFDLTDAQKRVIKEVYADFKSGKQMNRLIQGDVGSGKTIVGFICMLIAIGSGAQCAMMAPTEILAQQHFKNLKKYSDAMNLSVALLTGSSKKSERKKIHDGLLSGEINILIGTHALIENIVSFKNLGLAIIDEQHRFGVAQRSKLWQKNTTILPHVMVMTATPIPRTLAMTLYGDLDISVIDELPKGRKPIRTTHQFDSHRLQVNQFLKNQMAEGRQIYIVYPLIDESEKLDLKHLMDGYESICRAFPDKAISILHGKMKPDAKDYEMARFAKGETEIMVATTVIEVGVDVPNASVMVIENAERFGLSQLHQLRGRVGRGSDQSHCILMTSYKLSADSKIRIQTMVNSTSGFEIAEVDLKLRGPGDLMGTQQSGALDLLIADLGKDTQLLQEAREAAITILDVDPELQHVEHAPIKAQIQSLKKSVINWSRIS